MRTDYNIVDLSIDKGLRNHAISAAKNYIILLEAPPTARVTVKLNDNTADEIPLKESFAINAKGVQNIYISCNEVPGEKIKIGTSTTADNFNIVTAPVVKDIEEVARIGEVNNFSPALLQELDKIMNPYELIETVYLETGSTSLITLLNDTLDCDMIEVTSFVITKSYTYNWGSINTFLQLDGQYHFTNSNNSENGTPLSRPITKKIFDVRNKNILLKSGVYTPSTYTNISVTIIKKFNKKV